MAATIKMAAQLLLLINIIVLSRAHRNPSNYLEEMYSDIDVKNYVENARGLPGRRNQEWQYEGLPIEVTDPPKNVKENRDETLELEEPGLELPVVTTEKTTTETVRPTRSHPPMNHHYRRIFDPDESASIEDYPFMAAVLLNKELWCGAAIIDHDKVLTAAHCMQLQYNNRFFREYVKMLTVRIGSSNATGGGDLMRVVEIAFHPNYKPATLEFNVAVLKLHMNITFSPEQSVAEIDISRDATMPVNSTIKFLGWGSVLGGGGIGGTELLQQVDLPVYDTADCQTIYGKDLVTRTNFCAGYISQRKNVCNHDAGGPAVIGDKLVGILSFSSKRCDNLDKPAVFTTVGAVASWLDDLSQPPTQRQGIKLRTT